MFTGIVETTASVLAKSEIGLVVEKPDIFTDIKEGASIAVAGVCLTVTRFDEQSMSFDVIAETWAKTNLGSLGVGDRVNLERAMVAGARLDGHVVQGHVEGTARVIRAGAELTVEVPAELTSCIVPKGSIALDGVSLTVAKVLGNRVTVALIPTTLKMTTLGSLQSDDRVNVETDVLLRKKLADTRLQSQVYNATVTIS